MKVALTLDDFSVENNRLDLLFKLKEKFPSFKVSLFTIPRDIKAKKCKKCRRQSLKKIKQNLSWLQIIPHGLTHNGSEEFRNADYRPFIEQTLPAIKEAFDKDGLPFERGFKAPHYNWNDNVVRALDDEGWWGGVSPKRTDQPVTKRFYIYTHHLNDPFNNLRDVAKLQGHLNPSSPDDLEKNLDKLLALPKDIEWCYATEFIEEL